MNKFFKLHTGIFQYLRVELKKKRTALQLVKFLKSLFLQYIKQVLLLYKTLFLLLDPEYQKQKVNFEKYQQYKKDITNAYKIIQYFIKEGETRTDRKYIRRDFEKHGIIPKEFEQKILKDIYGVK